MAAGYKERDFVIAAESCGGVGTAESSGCVEALCECLSLVCFGHCSPSVARAIPTSGAAFDPELSAEFLVPDLKRPADFVKLMQLHCSTIKRSKSALGFVARLPEGAVMRMSHNPVPNFPISIKVVKTMPRQTTAPVNILVTGIEKPIDA